MDNKDMKRSFDRFAEKATEIADRATDRARDLVADHNEQIDSRLDKAAGFIDRKTGGKYSERISGGLDKTKSSLDRFAERDENDEPRDEQPR